MRRAAPETSVIAKVMANIRPNRDDEGKHVRRLPSKGFHRRRILAETMIDGVEHSFHATKGWRRKRVEAPAPRPAP